MLLAVFGKERGNWATRKIKNLLAVARLHIAQKKETLGHLLLSDGYKEVWDIAINDKVACNRKRCVWRSMGVIYQFCINKGEGTKFTQESNAISEGNGAS